MGEMVVRKKVDPMCMQPNWRIDYVSSMIIDEVVVLCSKLYIWLMPYVEKTRIRMNNHIDQFKLYNIVSVTNFISEANRNVFASLSFENENNITTIPWGSNCVFQTR